MDELLVGHSVDEGQKVAVALQVQQGLEASHARGVLLLAFVNGGIEFVDAFRPIGNNGDVEAVRIAGVDGFFVDLAGVKGTIGEEFFEDRNQKTESPRITRGRVES